MPRSLITTELDVRARYSQGGGIYRMIPAVVARPRDHDELDPVIDDARARGLPITIRGAGSAMPGNNVTDGYLLDMSGYEKRRCDIDPDERWAAVSPGVPLGRCNRLARKHGLQFPVDPSSSAWATFGGMVSTNAAGPHSVRFGSVRQWIDGVAMRTDDGYLSLTRGDAADPAHPAVQRWYRDADPLIRRHADIIGTRFPKTRKNSAGYALDHYLQSGSLVDIIVGSEGTLGLISDVNVLLAEIPQHRASLRVALRTRADLVPLIALLRESHPATIELLDRTFLRVIDHLPLTPERPELLREAAGLLLLDFEGDDYADILDCAVTAARAVQGIALDVRIATETGEIERMWKVRHGASPILAGLTDGRRSLQVIEDGCVPVDRLGEYLDAVESAAVAQRLDVVMFGHAGDGHVHANLLPNLLDHDWKERVRAVYDAVSAAIVRLGGTPSGEHGVGRLRAPLLQELYGAEVMECFRAVKTAFDPRHRFAAGILLADGADPLLHLKVGADAATLPAGIDEYLLRIEAEALWAERRW